MSTDTVQHFLNTNRDQVGINLGDPVFRGVYHGKQAHEDDLSDVVQRALDVGVKKLMITGSNLKESHHAVDLAKQYRMPAFPACGGLH
jgi:Tat protein secretion system quality control protein TatD with DNase activity